MPSPSRIPRALAFWLLLAAVAILAGALREAALRPLVGEPWAHWIGTVLVCAIFAALIGRFVNRLEPPAGPAELWTFGVIWVFLTIGFEVLFGRLALGSSWREWLAVQIPGAGQAWWLVLLTVLVAPPLLGRSRARAAGLSPIERRIEFISEEDAAEALGWLADLFRDAEVRYAAAGGLAARAWGAARPLVDLDFYVHDADLRRLAQDLVPYQVRPLEPFRDEHWDLTFMRVEYAGIPLELCVGEGARYRDAATGSWHDACPTFGASPERELFGVRFRVMPKHELLQYKKRVDRAVDRADVAAIERAGIDPS